MNTPLTLDYSTVFNAATHGMAITDLDSGVLVDVNAAWVAGTGIPAERARGRSGSELGLWRSVETRERILDELRRDGHVHRKEVELMLRGELVPHHVSGSMFETGGRRYVLWDFANLQAAKRAETALRDSEMRYRTLMEQSPLAIQVVGPDGRTRSVNRAWADLWGISIDESGDIHPLADAQLQRTGLLQAVHETFAGRWPSTQFVEFDRSADPDVPDSGGRRQARTVIYPSRSASGEIREVVLIQEDVTAVEAARAASRELMQQLETALEAGELGVWAFDAQRDSLIHFDARVSEFFGVPAFLGSAGVTLEQWLQRVHRDDQPRIRARIREASHTHLATQDTFRVFIGRGQVRHLHMAVVFKPGSTPSAQRAGGVVRDITKAVELEQQVIAASRRVEEANRSLTRHRDELEELVRERTGELVRARDESDSASRAKSAFLATVSHELRTPLNAIIGFSGLLHDGLSGPLSEVQAKQVLLIKRSGEQLLDLVQEILDLSSIEAGNLVVNPAAVPLITILQDQLEGFRLQAQTAGLELRPLVCDASIVVHADPRRLAQVVRNLLSNAVKYTVRGHVQLRVQRLEKVARIEVIDTGFGISREQLAQLFVPFQRIDHPGHLRAGTGLGLTISRRIVNAMGGDIGVDSAEGEGSLFWFTVPLQPSDRAPNPGA